MRISRSVVAIIAGVAGVQAAVHEFVVGSISSKFLYTVAFDDEALTLELIANITTPTVNSWIALSPDKKRLYGTDYAYLGTVEVSEYIPKFPSFTINNSSSIVLDKTLELPECNGTSIWVGADPSPPHSVFGVDFWTNPGCGATMSVDESGTLDTVMQNFNYWPNSSAHGGAFSPDGKYFYSADTQGNAVWAHKINRPDGTLGDLVNVVLGPFNGSDPRHVAVHQSGKTVYAVMEHGSMIVSYQVDPETGVLTQDKALYSLLPNGYDLDNYWADEVAVSPSGKYLWATNRGKEGRKGYISVFELDDCGRIKNQNFLIETTTTGGVANAVAVMEDNDRFVALPDNDLGGVEMWELAEDAMSAWPVARIDIKDIPENGRYNSGCCANVVWLS